MQPLSPSHQTHLDAYGEYLRQKTMTEKSRQRPLNLIRRYLHYLDEAYPGIAATRISYPQCCGFLQTLKHLKVSSYNTYLIDLRGFLQFLEKQHGAKPVSHELKCETMEQNLPRDLPLSLMQQLCTPTAAEAEVLQTCLLAMRDQAIIELLWSTGMRSCELLQLRVGDFSSDLGICAVTAAKHGVDHDAYLGKPAIAALRRYFTARGLHLRKDAHVWAFPGRKEQRPLSYSALNDLVKKLGRVRTGCPVTPHLIRHAFATQMLIRCGCLRSVQLLLGHASIKNTERYCKLRLLHLHKAVQGFHPHGSRAGKAKNDTEALDRKEANE